MKRLFTVFAAVLMLCCATWAQTLVGLPQYGITLSGSSKSVSLANHSGKAIIATMVSMVHANGKRADFRVYHLASIGDGKSLAIAGTGPEYMPGYSDSPVVEIRLWAVVFADGELRGEDPYAGAASFQAEMEKKFQTIVETGKLAATGDWLELGRRATHDLDVSGDFWNSYAGKYAKQLVDTRNGSGGEPAAQALAGKFRALPEHFWRTK